MGPGPWSEVSFQPVGVPTDPSVPTVHEMLPVYLVCYLGTGVGASEGSVAWQEAGRGWYQE